MLNAEHELSRAHRIGKVQTLLASCEAGLKSLGSGNFRSRSVPTPVQKVFGQVDGERTLIGIAHNRDQLMDIADFASTQGIAIEVAEDIIWKETFRDEEIVREANVRIEEIRRQWERNDFSSNSVMSLIKAHFVIASTMIGIKVSPCKSKYARSTEDEILKMRGEARDQEGIGATFVRNRLKDLCAQFGSARALDEFCEQLRIYESKSSRGKFCDKPYVLRASTESGSVRFKDAFSLLRVLNFSLKKRQETVVFSRKVIVGHDKEGNDIVEQVPHYTTLTPAELAELIALKLALGVEHEATKNPEIRDMEWHFKRLAKWLQRRTNRPERGGDLHESELAKSPEDRESSKSHDDDDEPYYTALGAWCRSRKTGRWNLVRNFGKLVVGEGWVVTRKLDHVWFIRRPYSYKGTKTLVRDKVKTRLVSVKGDVVKTTKSKTIVDHQSTWVITKRHKTHWDVELVEKTEKREVKLPDSQVVVGNHPTKDGHKTKSEVWEHTTETYVASNVAPMHEEEVVRKDWDLLIGPKAPSLFDDRRLPKEADGSFHKTYVGPSFVKLEQIGDEIVPVKPGRCEMHDGRFFASFKEAEKTDPNAVLQECHTMHVTKVHLNPTSWAPKIRVRNTYEDPSGEGDPIVWEKWLPASLMDSHGNPNVVIDKYVNDYGTEKERIVFANIPPIFRGEEPEFVLPMLTPVFRRYINECLWTGDLVIPPILEVVHKRGRLKGKVSEQQELRAEDINFLEALGIAPDDLEEEFDEVEERASKWDRTYRTLHLFLPLRHPMVPEVFRLNKLPVGFKDMALQVQCSGLGAHLLRYTREHGGSVRHEYWREGPEWDSVWEPMNRFRRETSDGSVYHVNYVWE